MARLVLSRTSNKFWGVVGFELLGSIILLASAYVVGSSWSSGWQWWQTISLAVSTIGSVSLFVLAIGNLSVNSLSREIMGLALLTTIALAILVSGNWAWIGLAAVGYILILAGALWGMPREV